MLRKKTWWPSRIESTPEQVWLHKFMFVVCLCDLQGSYTSLWKFCTRLASEFAWTLASHICGHAFQMFVKANVSFMFCFVVDD